MAHRIVGKMAPSMISEWSFVKLGWKLLKPIRAWFNWFAAVRTMPAKLSEIERRIAELKPRDETPKYRKCPECGERDFRLQDRYRHHPDVFARTRYFHEKWLCFACGHRETNNIEEPD